MRCERGGRMDKNHETMIRIMHLKGKYFKARVTFDACGTS